MNNIHLIGSERQENGGWGLKKRRQPTGKWSKARIALSGFPMTDPATSPQLETKTPKPAEASLSQDLASVLQKMHDAPVTIGDMEKALKGRGFMLMIVILTAPFAVLPFAIPGLNIPISAAVILIGLRMTLGLKPWLPKKILNKNIGGGLIQKVLTRILPMSQKLEKWLQERWTFLFWPGAKNLIGLALAWSALMLLMPPPMINSPPAVAIILLAIGIMTRDGLMVILGYIVMFGMTVYLYFIGSVIWASVTWVYVLLAGWVKALGS
jgi:hypothetical protein